MHRKTHYLSAAVFLLLIVLIASCSGDISKSNQVLARVGDREITSAYFERQVADLPEGVREASQQGEGKKAVLQGLVDREILYQQALKKKIDKDVELNRRFEDLKKELVIKTYLESQLGGKIKVDDAEAGNYYNSHPREYQHREEVRISQIVVPDQAKAQEIQEKLSIKRDFGELAASLSTDRQSAARQGDVGWFTYSKLPPQIREEVFRLNTGEVSQPFHVGEGYEIYRITDRRTVSLPLEQVKEVIRAQLFAEKSQKEVQAVVDGLKKDVVVKVNEQLLR